MKKIFKMFLSFVVIVLLLGIAGCNAGTNELQSKIDSLQSQLEEMNNRLVEMEEQQVEMNDKMVEYCSDIIPSSISFGVQYVKQTVGAEENYQIIKSVSKLNDYIASEKQKIDLPDFVLFKDEVVNKYNDEYFENSFIVIFMKGLGSGSFDFRVNDVQASRYRLIINYEIVLPEGYGEYVEVTCDMAYWYSFVELSNEYSTINNVYLTSLKH